MDYRIYFNISKININYIYTMFKYMIILMIPIMINYM